MPAFSLDDAPPYLPVRLHSLVHSSVVTSMLPYHYPPVGGNPRRRFSAWAPLNLRRKIVKLVSCYAFFKGLLLLSQPPSCLNNSTSFPTKQRLGTLADGLGSFPFATRTCSALLTRWLKTLRIRSLVRVGTQQGPSPFQFLYLARKTSTAIPKYISGSTSYCQVRLAFYPLPQVIPAICRWHGFGPPFISQ